MPRMFKKSAGGFVEISAAPREYKSELQKFAEFQVKEIFNEPYDKENEQMRKTYDAIIAGYNLAAEASVDWLSGSGYRENLREYCDGLREYMRRGEIIEESAVLEDFYKPTVLVKIRDFYKSDTPNVIRSYDTIEEARVYVDGVKTALSSIEKEYRCDFCRFDEDDGMHKGFMIDIF